MTEAEWLASDRPDVMLVWLEERGLRLVKKDDAFMSRKWVDVGVTSRDCHLKVAGVIEKLIAEAVVVEREACAKLAETTSPDISYCVGEAAVRSLMHRTVAAAIRARSNQ